jgi:two-component system, cell cycle response regulator DivK
VSDRAIEAIRNLRLLRLVRSRSMAGEPILIVDDNPANLKLARVLLAGEGYEVRVAVDAEEALALLASFQPRLVLMDLQLPGMDGLSLTRRLKDDPATRDVAILALTAYAMKGDEAKALRAGCDGYVTKPIDTRTLPLVIARLLGARVRRPAP